MRCGKQKSVVSEFAPVTWKSPCVHEEATLHQVSPYIGKLKSSIAQDLIKKYTKKGDLIVDPFCGSGTIPLEAVILGREVFCADVSPYAKVLTKAKLQAPPNVTIALSQAKAALSESEKLQQAASIKVPTWVKSFFHPRTLREILKFAMICKKQKNEFLMACLLGILHHQRPGFLSYPSSHLVPYLRNKKFPREQYPELYAYRALKPRLLSKIKRVYKRFPVDALKKSRFVQASVQKLNFPDRFDCLITSPPYMNALDYGRDNRLRLWFVDFWTADMFDHNVTRKRESFIEAITSLAEHLENNLSIGGHGIFIVGEETNRGFDAHPSKVVRETLAQTAKSLQLVKVITDQIPDIRRTRRECKGVKNENILVFKKIK